MKVLSIDPGLRDCGMALWTGEGRLLAADLARGAQDTGIVNHPAWAHMACAVLNMFHCWAGRQLVYDGEQLHLVCEFPKVYTAGKSKGDPEDLLQLAGVVGMICPLFAGIQSTARIVRPHQWKGSVRKDIMTARIMAYLEADELVCCNPRVPKSLAHNMFDAVGIGLWHFGRLHA